MRFYIDEDVQRLIRGLTYAEALPENRVEVKRRDTPFFDWLYCRPFGSYLNIDSGGGDVLTFRFGAKEEGDFSGDYLIFNSSHTKVTTDDETYYRQAPDLGTVELNDAFINGTITGRVADQAARYGLNGLVNGEIIAQDDNGTYWIVIDQDETSNSAGWEPAPEHEYLDLDAELERTLNGAKTSTLTFTLRVWNDVNQGNEGVPTTAAPAYPLPGAMAIVRPDITALTGGTGASLDGIPTTLIVLATYPVFYFIRTAAGSGMQGWLLVSGTDAENAANGVVRPDDFNASTNAKVWKQVI
jgi:hypothetical protein